MWRDAYDLVANHIKSCVIGNSKQMLEHLKQRTSTPDLPDASTFNDLGVAQGRGVEGRLIVRKRWAAAIQRMRSIGGLAVDLAGR